MSGDKVISALAELDNIFKWMRTIYKAADTVYEDLHRMLSLEFPSSYPSNAHGEVPHILLSPQCENPEKHLPGYPEGQMVCQV